MITHTIAAALICANLAAPMVVDSQPMPAMQVESLGTFEVTAYAEDEITKTGTVPRPMKTVAVDPDVIPLGVSYGYIRLVMSGREKGENTIRKINEYIKEL